MTKKPPAKVWAWDIEAVDWDQPVCVVGVSSDGDVERFSGVGCLERFGDQVIEKARGTFVAHAGGIYDTILYTQVREKPWKELIMSGSAVLSANDTGLRLRDSFRWWLSGLKKVGEYLDKKEQQRAAPRHAPGHWLKKDVDRQRIADLTDEERLAYCESDSTILLEGVKQAREYLEDRGARAGWTAGSCALALLEQLEPATWRHLARHALDLETAIGAGACVRGARVENWARGVVPLVHVYDLKSAYPASYADTPIGVGAVHLGPDDKDRPGAVWRVRWFWPWRDRIPPVLDQVTGAGAGWCEAWCVPEELDLLAEHEIAVTRIEGWAPLAMIPAGQVFVRDLYAEKEKGSFFGKVYLNSLHGKFSESPIKTSWTNEKPAQWYGKEPDLVGDYWRALQADTDPRGRVSRHIQPIAGAHILGRTRATLARHIQAVTDAGGEVYYCDTDSIHTNLPPERMPQRLSNDLGALAWEGGPFTGYYVAPKAYALVPHDPVAAAAGKLKGALKGMPWGSMRDGVVVDDGPRGVPLFRQARDKEVGSDLRLEVFQRALTEPRGVELIKEGITSFVGGLRKKEGWGKEQQPRTLRPIERGKRWRDDEPTTWAYQTPAEQLTERGAAAPAFSHDPYEEKKEEPDGFSE